MLVKQTGPDCHSVGRWQCNPALDKALQLPSQTAHQIGKKASKLCSLMLLTGSGSVIAVPINTLVTSCLVVSSPYGAAPCSSGAPTTDTHTPQAPVFQGTVNVHSLPTTQHKCSSQTPRGTRSCWVAKKLLLRSQPRLPLPSATKFATNDNQQTSPPHTHLCKAHAFRAERHECRQLVGREAICAPEAGLRCDIQHHPVDWLTSVCCCRLFHSVPVGA